MRKLLKYEMRAMNRRLFPIYAGMLAIALLNGFFGMGAMVQDSSAIEHMLDALPGPLSFLLSMMQVVIVTLFFGILMGMMVVWLLTTINRFNKGLLGEEGYLMFTLPVTTGRLIGSKLLASSIHLVLASLVALLSMCFMAGTTGISAFFRLMSDADFGSFFGELARACPTWPIVVLEFLAFCALSVFGTVLHFYLSMALGHLSNSHRTLMSVLAYIGISVVMSMLTSMGFSGLMLLENVGFVENMARFVFAHGQLAGHLMMLALIALSVAECAVFWFGTRYILKRRLNLE